jgi:hypothetical protein
VAADERGEDLDHSQSVGWGVVRDAFQGVDPAQADVEPIRTGLAELVDSAGEPVGDLAFLGDGDLLTQTLVATLGLFAGELELFAGAVVAALGLLTGVLELLAADTGLPQGDRGAMPAPPRTSRAARPWSRVVRTSFWSLSRPSWRAA